MDPVYSHIEFCRDAETLWEKIKSGRWDWLGVHPKGQFVLGSPPAARITDHAAATVMRGGVAEGEHGVKIEMEPGKPSSVDWWPDEAAAIACFEAEVAKYREEVGPILVRIRRIEKREVVEEEFVVSRVPNYR